MKTINTIKKTGILFLQLLIPVIGLAATTSWKGTINTNWATSSNWTNGVPSSTTDVIIGDANFTGVNQPNLDNSGQMASLIIGNGTMACTLIINTNDLIVNGPVTIGPNGTISHTGDKKFEIKGHFTNTGVYNATNDNSELKFFGGSMNISGTGTFNCKKVNLSNSGNATLVSGTFFVGRELEITSGHTFSQTGGIVKINRTFKNTGVYNASAGTIQFTGNEGGADFSGTNQFFHFILDGGVNCGLGGGGANISVGGDFTNNNSAASFSGVNLTFNGSGNQSITWAGTGKTCNDFIVNKTGGVLSLASNLYVGDDFTNSAGTFSGAGYTAFFYNSGNISGPGNTQFGTLNIASDASTSLQSSVSAIQLIIAGGGHHSTLTQSLGSVLTITGNAVVEQPTSNSQNATWSVNAGTATVSGNLIIGGSNITTSRVSRVLVTTGTLNISGDIVFNSPALVTANAKMDLSGGAGTVNLSGNIALTNGTGNIIPGSTSTFNWNGTSPQTFNLSSSLNYANVKFNNSNASGVTSNAAITSSDVSGNMSVESGLFQNGGYGIAGSSVKTFRVYNGATFKLTGTSGMVTGFLTKTFDDASTVNYAGSIQTVSGETYGHLLITNAGAKTGSAVSTVDGNLEINSSGTFISSNTLTVYGNVTIGASSFLTTGVCTQNYKSNFNNSGTLNPTGTTFVFNGTSPQTITGATTFSNLTMSNSNGLTINNNVTVSGTLNFTSGKISTGTNFLILGSSGTITNASSSTGWVAGNLTMPVLTGTTTRIFPVGDASTYSPLEYSSMVVSTPGTISVKAVSGTHPAFILSPFSGSPSVNRYWIVTNASTAMATYKVRANFSSGCIGSGYSTNNGRVHLYNGSNWTTATAGTNATLYNEGTGISTLGDVYVSHCGQVPVLSSISPNSGIRLSTYNITITGSNFLSGITNIVVPSGMTISAATVVSSTTMTAQLSMSGSCQTGPNNIYVSNSTGTGSSGNITFTVTSPVPTVTNLLPASGNRGETLNITATGTNFVSTTTFNFGSGITLNSVTVVSPTSAIANITIANGTSNLGVRSINITNPSPGGGTSGNINFNVTNWKIFNTLNGNWDTYTNWFPNFKPGSGDDAVLPYGKIAYITASEGSMANLKVSGTLVIEPGGVLEITNSLQIDTYGKLIVRGALPTFSTLENYGTIEIASEVDMAIPDLGVPYKNLEISGNGVKTLDNNLQITGNMVVNGKLSLSGKTISLTGNWENNGTLFSDYGTVDFNGTGAQTIDGTTESKFYNLSISNSSSSGVILQGSSAVKGTLALGAGSKFTTTGESFTFLSDSLETARLAPVPADAQFIGGAVLQRYVNAGSGYAMMGFGIDEPAISEIDDDLNVGTPTATSNLWYYNEAANGGMNNSFVSPGNFSATLTPGRGLFLLKSNTSPVTLDIAGTPYIGPINFPVTYTISTPNPIPNADGWNLVCNPYPSEIDWDAATGWTKTNIASTIYVWNPVYKDYKVYQSGVGGGWSNKIASSQAFWVKATGPNPVLAATENVKVQTSSTFYKLNANITDALTLRIANNLDTNRFDEAYIRFVAGSNPNYEDNYDSHRLISSSSLVPNISTKSSDSVLLAINAMGELDESFVVPVVVRTNATGTFKFSMPDLGDFPASTCVVLEDTQLGTFTNLRTDTYTCTINSTTSANARFKLRVDPPVKITPANPTCNAEGNGQIVASGQANGPWTYTWKDQSGNIVKQTPATMNPDTLQNLTSGNYSVTITNSAGYCLEAVESVTLIEPSPITGSTVVNNVTCFGAGNGKATLFAMGGNGPYEYYWSNGSTTTVLENLKPGEYTVMITDANMCMGNTKIVVTEPDALSDNLKKSDIGFCNPGKGGEISIEPAGGVAPYTISWAHSASETGTSMLNLQPGYYSYTIEDKNGCKLGNEVTIEELPQVKAGFTANADSVYLENGASIQFSNDTYGTGTWSWNFGDGNSSKDENPVHQYTSPGTYAVTLLVTSGNCTDQYTMNVTVVNLKEENRTFSIYPNPNSGEFLKVNLEGYNDQEISVVMYDISGKAVLSKRIMKTDNHFVIDLSGGGAENLNSGNYVVSVVTPDKSYSKKLVVTSSRRR